MKKIILFLFTGLLFCSVQAQEQRAASPASTLKQRVGLTDITIEYSRPGVKDRTIFANDGLVPFGEVWRTGANSATKITFSDDVMIEGENLAAGSYAILTVPNKNSWEIKFYSHDSSSWGSYRDKEPALAVTAASRNIDVPIETFVINIGHIRDQSATLNFVWEHTMVPVELKVK